MADEMLITFLVLLVKGCFIDTSKKLCRVEPMMNVNRLLLLMHRNAYRCTRIDY